MQALRQIDGEGAAISYRLTTIDVQEDARGIAKLELATSRRR
jgi:hypothetical protein